MKLTRGSLVVSVLLGMVTLLAAQSQPAVASTQTLTDFDALGNGSITSALVNRSAIISAMTKSSSTINVAADIYMVDNSTLISISAFSGTLVFAPGASLQLSRTRLVQVVSRIHSVACTSTAAPVQPSRTFQNLTINWPYPAGTLRDDLV
jgi:hypothetical protein